MRRNEKLAIHLLTSAVLAMLVAMTPATASVMSALQTITSYRDNSVVNYDNIAIWLNRRVIKKGGGYE